MKKILILVTATMLSCTGNNVKNKKENNLDTLSKEIVINQVESDESKENWEVFTYDSDTLHQKVELKYITDNEIKFAITSENAKFKKVKKIEGIALMTKSDNAELEEDEEGNAIQVSEYIYTNGTCWISLRIDMENKTNLKINEADCNIFDKATDLNTNIFLQKK